MRTEVYLGVGTPVSPYGETPVVPVDDARGLDLASTHTRLARSKSTSLPTEMMRAALPYPESPVLGASLAAARAVHRLFHALGRKLAHDIEWIAVPRNVKRRWQTQRWTITFEGRERERRCGSRGE